MLWLIVLWLAWCAAHSLLITDGVRLWVERRGGVVHGLYRLGYVCFSVIGLLPLFWYTATLPQQPFDLSSVWIRFVQVLLGLYALIMFVGGLRVYDLRTFLGLRQWCDYRAGRASKPPCFEKTGILRHIRHPWYSGGIALLWSLPELTDVTLTIRSLLTAYLVVGTLLEERKLRLRFGEPYLTYCREVGMLIPWRHSR